MKVRYTVAAKADLAALRAYIAKESPLNARRFIARIRSAVNRLKRFPTSGAVVEEWGRDNVRELFVGNYRIIYWITAKEVHIHSVVHAARRLPHPPEE